MFDTLAPFSIQKTRLRKLVASPHYRVLSEILIEKLDFSSISPQSQILLHSGPFFSLSSMFGEHKVITEKNCYQKYVRHPCPILHTKNRTSKALGFAAISFYVRNFVHKHIYIYIHTNTHTHTHTHIYHVVRLIILIYIYIIYTSGSRSR